MFQYSFSFENGCVAVILSFVAIVSTTFLFLKIYRDLVSWYEKRSGKTVPPKAYSNAEPFLVFVAALVIVVPLAYEELGRTVPPTPTGGVSADPTPGTVPQKSEKGGASMKRGQGKSSYSTRRGTKAPTDVEACPGSDSGTGPCSTNAIPGDSSSTMSSAPRGRKVENSGGIHYSLQAKHP
jgi:hypothetical protein